MPDDDSDTRPPHTGTPLEELDHDMPVTVEYLGGDDPSLDALVVSPEADEEVVEINRRRTDRGIEPLEPIVVPHEDAEDRMPISSTRIVNGEIDKHGTLRDNEREWNCGLTQRPSTL